MMPIQRLPRTKAKRCRYRFEVSQRSGFLLNLERVYRPRRLAGALAGGNVAQRQSGRFISARSFPTLNYESRTSQARMSGTLLFDSPSPQDLPVLATRPASARPRCHRLERVQNSVLAAIRAVLIPDPPFGSPRNIDQPGGRSRIVACLTGRVLSNCRCRLS